MKRNTTIALGLAMALSLGAAGAQAQAPQRDSARAKAGQHEGKGQRGERGERGARGQRGQRGHGFLLRGITLSDAQKQQLQQLREGQRVQHQQSREALKTNFAAARTARQKGDTATARAEMQKVRTAMEQQRERQASALRGILTSEQRVQFDKNLAEAKQRQQERAAKGKGDRAGFRRGA